MNLYDIYYEDGAMDANTTLPKVATTNIRYVRNTNGDGHKLYPNGSGSWWTFDEATKGGHPEAQKHAANKLADLTERYFQVKPSLKKGNVGRIKQHRQVIAAWGVGDATEITQVVDQMAQAIVAIALIAGYMEKGYYDIEVVDENMKVLEGETLIA